MRLKNISEETVINKINSFIDSNLESKNPIYGRYTQEDYDKLYNIAKQMNDISKIGMFINEKGTVSLVLVHVYELNSGADYVVVDL